MRIKLNVPKWSMDFKLFCITHEMTAVDASKKTGLSLGTIQAYYIGARTPRKKACKQIYETIGFDMSTAIYESEKREVTA